MILSRSNIISQFKRMEITLVYVRDTLMAGSVVMKDIPDDVAAFGNPCKVQKSNQ